MTIAIGQLPSSQRGKSCKFLLMGIVCLHENALNSARYTTFIYSCSLHFDQRIRGNIRQMGGSISSAKEIEEGAAILERFNCASKPTYMIRMSFTAESLPEVCQRIAGPAYISI